MAMPATASSVQGQIACMKRVKGSAWLCKINGWGRRTLWEWDGSAACSTDADFVLPCYDAELDAMLVARYKAEYKGVDDDTRRVLAILLRIDRLGGERLLG
jgi:hypothetical protein